MNARLLLVLYFNIVILIIVVKLIGKFSCRLEKCTFMHITAVRMLHPLTNHHGADINKELISAIVHTPQCLGVSCEYVCGMCWTCHTQQHMGRTQTAATDESES